jgi:hypothetical protein
MTRVVYQKSGKSANFERYSITAELVAIVGSLAGRIGGATESD